MWCSEDMFNLLVLSVLNNCFDKRSLLNLVIRLELLTDMRILFMKIFICSYNLWSCFLSTSFNLSKAIPAPHRLHCFTLERIYQCLDLRLQR